MGDRLHPPGFSDLPTALRLHRILFRSKVEAALYTLQVPRGAIIGKTGKPPGLPGGGLPMFDSNTGLFNLKCSKFKKNMSLRRKFSFWQPWMVVFFQKKSSFSKKLKTKFYLKKSLHFRKPALWSVILCKSVKKQRKKIRAKNGNGDRLVLIFQCLGPPVHTAGMWKDAPLSLHCH